MKKLKPINNRLNGFTTYLLLTYPNFLVINEPNRSALPCSLPEAKLARASAQLTWRNQQPRKESSQTIYLIYFALSSTASTRFRLPIHVLSSYFFSYFSALGTPCLTLPPTLLPIVLAILLGRFLLGYWPFMTVMTILCRC